MSDTTNFDYKNLSPFKWFVLENFPFIEADFDALTEWQLFCKIGKEINKIINSQNMVGEQAETLTNAFNNLKNYIDNYFNNLDVQEEINNKLNEMVQTGELQNLLSEQYDELKNEVNNTISQNYTKINNRIDAQNDKISNLSSQINITGTTPIPVGSISNMTDTTKIYLLTTDGYYYYYNGSNWVQGGKYQSKYIEHNSIQNFQIKRKDVYFENNTFYKDLLYLATEIKEGYKCSGYNQSTYLPTFAEDNNFICFIFNMSDLQNYIGKLKFGYDKSKTYSCYVYYTENTKGFNGNSTGITDSNNFANCDLTYNNLLICLPISSCYYHTTDINYYTNNALDDLGQMIKIENKNINRQIFGNNISIKKLDLTKFNGVTIYPNRVITGYSTSENRILLGYKQNYTAILLDKNIFTDFTNLRDIRMKVNENMENVQMIVGSNEGNAGFNFQKNYLLNTWGQYYDSTNHIYNWGAFISNNLYYMNNFTKFGFSFMTTDLEFYTETFNSLNPNYELFTNYVTENNVQDLINKNNLMCSVNIFNSIGAIGDSYTAGSVQHSDGRWSDVTNQSYIAVLGKRSGVNYSNFGVGGTSTRTYLTNGLQKVLTDTPKDFYMLAFGINDMAIGTEYIGSIDDIKEDYTQNADSFYGNYGKIISQVLLHAPKTKLLLVKIQIPGTNVGLFNTAIENIANHFGIPFINPFDDVFFTSQQYTNRPGGHPTILGYVGMGLAYERLINKCILNNLNYFLYSTIG